MIANLPQNEVKDEMDQDEDSTSDPAISSKEMEVDEEELTSHAPLNQAIQIFARIRPRRSNPHIKSKGENSSKVVVDNPIPGDAGEPQLHFHVPRNESAGLINNSKEHFGFRFDRVFGEDTKQEEVFDHVAKETVLR
jgi:kinesin family protein 6/9